RGRRFHLRRLGQMVLASLTGLLVRRGEALHALPLPGLKLERRPAHAEREDRMAGAAPSCYLRGSSSENSVHLASAKSLALATCLCALACAGPGGNSGSDGQQMNGCNVRSFGAKGDGKAKDTQAIQRAVDRCSTVWLPSGTYLSGTIRLHDGVTLAM